MKQSWSIVKVGLAVATLLPAVVFAGFSLWFLFDMMRSITRFFEALAVVVPFYFPVACGIGVAWLGTRGRGRVVGFAAGALSIGLGFALFGFLTVGAGWRYVPAGTAASKYLKTEDGQLSELWRPGINKQSVILSALFARRI